MSLIQSMYLQLNRWYGEWHKLRLKVHKIPAPETSPDKDLPVPTNDATIAEKADEGEWTKLLRDLGEDSPLRNKDFWEVPIKTRVQVLYTVLNFNTMHWQPLGKTLRGLDPEQIRLESLGQDSKGREVYVST